MSANALFDRIAIIGLGLMGGSLGLAIKRKGLAGSVTGYARRVQTRDMALASAAVDEVFDRPEQAVRDAGLIVFCTTINSIPDLAQACLSGLAKGSVLTDVGSTKMQITAKLDKLLAGGAGRYVGSHPVAGSERQGLKMARADLYDNAVVIVTRTAVTDPAALKKVEQFWKILGARVYVASPEEHDLLMARTSHLPHLVAAMLAANVGREQIEQLQAFCGTGFVDTTRIADGSPELWRDVICSNKAAVLNELKEFKKQLELMTKLVQGSDGAALQQFLEESRSRRRKLVSNRK